MWHMIDSVYKKNICTESYALSYLSHLFILKYENSSNNFFISLYYYSDKPHLVEHQQGTAELGTNVSELKTQLLEMDGNRLLTLVTQKWSNYAPQTL